MLTNNREKFGSLAQVLHWATAAMIIGQYALAKLAERADEAGSPLTQLALLANHKSLGMSILTLAIVRVGWRLINPPPAPPASIPLWQNRAAAVTHWALYVLIFAIPLSGWLMSSASAYSVSWFNLFTFPDLVEPNEVLKDQFHEMHHYLAEALFVLALVHIGAALKHHFYDRDTVLKGMSSITSMGVFTGLLLSILFALNSVSAPTNKTPPPAEPLPQSKQPLNETTEFPLDSSELTLWKIDYASSELAFSATQAGADFTGVWETWSAQVYFDPQNLEASQARVEITISSVNTNDNDRDTTLMDNDWFDQTNHQLASYQANKFTVTEHGNFIAHGQLKIKGFTTEVPLEFTLSDDGELLTGKAQLDRLKLQVGTGEWLDTTWVGESVQVLVKLVRME